MPREAAVGLEGLEVDARVTSTAALTSVRDFPLFDGDFFPDKVHDVIEKAKQPPAALAKPARGKGKAAVGTSRLKRSETLAIADGMRAEASGSQYAFLVATLAPPEDGPMPVPREKHIGPNVRLLYLLQLAACSV